MKVMLRKYGAFTLIEILCVTIIIGFLVPSIIGIYNFLIKANKDFVARQTSIRQGYEFFEKLNIMMQDYTIDYEEYYNRQMVGCVEGGGTGSNFTWNISTGGNCTKFTAYGNQNTTQRWLGASQMSGKFHDIYNCSSKVSTSDGNIYGLPRTVSKDDCGKFGVEQSFGQYKSLFNDVRDPTLNEDDEDLGRPVNSNIKAIVDEKNIQELYLISHDGKNRLYFRRKLSDKHGEFAQYKIQILRLRGFDAGQDHNFESSNTQGLYDGQIDTWACDTSMGFVGSGKSVGGAYSQYRLPKDVDDCWVDLTHGTTNAFAWNISISPLNEPDLYWAEVDRQINPYMKILLVNGVYFSEFYSKESIGSSITEFKVPIETTINMKDFYRE